MKNRRCRPTSVLLLLALAVPAYGWNAFGHMTVAYLAYQQLTPQTRDRVNTLLGLNPYHKRIWPGMVPAATPAADKDLIIFMIAATWPDEIKSDGSYHSDGPHNGNRPPDDPSAKRNIGYRDHLLHKYWHFMDTPFSQDGTALPAIPDPNAQTQIGVFRATLSSSKPDPVKSYDLTWLLHLVGDVHQPLHCATRVSHADPEGDDGGNGVQLSCTGCSSELHAFWDGVLGKSKVPASVIKFAKTVPAPDPTLASKSKEEDWIKESEAAAEKMVYVTPIGAGDGPFSLTTTYRTKAKALGTERVALAGARLANLLNDELK